MNMTLNLEKCYHFQMTKPKPLVSVLMPVFNTGKYTEDAIKSILNQSYTDFEFIIVDDGSTDNTAQIISGFQDPRIKVIQNEINLGLAASLNNGLALAQGKFIARMDGDDISFPDRFLKQVTYLNQNPKVGVVGAWYQWTDSEGNPGKIKRFPMDNGVIQWKLIVDAQPIAHPVVMMRAEALREINGYKDMRYSQDYDLFYRLSKNWEFHNLQEVLLLRREHEQRIGKSHTEEQMANTAQTRQEMIQELIGEKVPLKMIMDSFPPHSNGIDDLDLLSLVDRIYRKFSSQIRLFDSERKIIKYQVGHIFLGSKIKDPVNRLKYFVKGLSINLASIGDFVKMKVSEKSTPSWLNRFLRSIWRFVNKLSPGARKMII